MPKNIAIGTLEVKREAARLVYSSLTAARALTHERYYSEQDKRDALRIYCTTKTTKQALCLSFGISETTFQRNMTALKASTNTPDISTEQLIFLFEKRPSEMKEKLDKLFLYSRTAHGPPPFLPEPILHTISTLFSLRLESGSGLSSAASTAFVKGVLDIQSKTLLQSPIDKDKITGNKQAQAAGGAVNPGFWKRTVQARNGPMVPPVATTSKVDSAAGREGLRTVDATGSTEKKKRKKRAATSIKPPQYFVKVSQLSHKRAKSGSPLVSSIMNRNFLDLFDALYNEGKLKTRQPNADQIYNGDEIGIDPNGSFLNYFTNWARTQLQRFFRIVTGEKAPFWTTVFYYSCADGTHCVPPVIVHKGGGAQTVGANFIRGLPDKWYFHSTPSGYMDAEGFRAVAESFIAYTKPRPDYPMFLFIDGHESHWDSRALNYLLDNNVYVLFLTSNNSNNDQPNDMGNNAQLKQHYSHEIERW